MAKILDLVATSIDSLLIGIASTASRVKSITGGIAIRNRADSADAALTASTINASGDTGLVINSDAANTGADRSITLARPTSGMAASYTLTLPTSAGSPSQVLGTDGAGILSWVANGSAADKLTVDTTALAFGSGATVSMFTLPANAVVESVRVIVDTVFNGTPSMSVGISGNTSKYMASTRVDLTDTAGAKVYEVTPGLASVGSTEALQIAYTAGGATAGAARVEVDYAVPS